MHLNNYCFDRLDPGVKMMRLMLRCWEINSDMLIYYVLLEILSCMALLCPQARLAQQQYLSPLMWRSLEYDKLGEMKLSLHLRCFPVVFTPAAFMYEPTYCVCIVVHSQISCDSDVRAFIRTWGAFECIIRLKFGSNT